MMPWQLPKKRIMRELNSEHSNSIEILLFPHTINFNAALEAFAVFKPQIFNLEAPAFDDGSAAIVTKCIFSGITGDIAGIYISQAGI